MFGVRDLLQDVLWSAFAFVLRWASTARRHWRRIVATTTMTIAVVRGIIWVAKAVASAGTVDTALNLIGLGEYVRPFEDAVDSVVHWALSLIVSTS